MKTDKFKLKHASEPWYVMESKKLKHKQCRWIVSGRNYIAKVYGGTDYMSAGDAIANADHIVACANACKGINPAAVPDMFAALEAAVDYKQNSGVYGELDELSDETVQKIKKAITKAREVK